MSVSSQDLNLRDQSAWQCAARVYAGDEIRENDPALSALVRDELIEAVMQKQDLQPIFDGIWGTADPDEPGGSRRYCDF